MHSDSRVLCHLRQEQRQKQQTQPLLNLQQQENLMLTPPLLTKALKAHRGLQLRLPLALLLLLPKVQQHQQ